MNDMSLWVRDTLLMIMFAKGIIRITNGNQYLRDIWDIEFQTDVKTVAIREKRKRMEKREKVL